MGNWLKKKGLSIRPKIGYGAWGSSRSVRISTLPRVWGNWPLLLPSCAARCRHAALRGGEARCGCTAHCGHAACCVREAAGRDQTAGPGWVADRGPEVRLVARKHVELRRVAARRLVVVARRDIVAGVAGRHVVVRRLVIVVGEVVAGRLVVAGVARVLVRYEILGPS